MASWTEEERQRAKDEWWTAVMDQFDNDEEFVKEISLDFEKEVKQNLSKIEFSLHEPVSYFFSLDILRFGGGKKLKVQFYFNFFFFS